MTHKNLNDVILEVYKPKSPDEQKFVDKHVTIKHKDRNGNDDDVFKGNTKYIKRKEERHGYDVGEDEKVYESIEELEEAIEDKEDVPFAGPYKNTGTRKDQYGNTIKNVAKHLAKKAMNAQKMKEDADLREAPLLGRGMSPEARARDIEQSDREYVKQVQFKNKWKKANPGKKWPGWSHPSIKFNEEADQIDELSRDTLVNYMAKASDASGHRKLPTKKVDNRYKGVATAGKKFDAKWRHGISELTGEEVEDIDSLLDEALDLLNSIDEKTLTPAELKKREEIVKAVKRGDPKMDKSMAYAIATKTAKRVAEESEELDEALDSFGPELQAKASKHFAKVDPNYKTTLSKGGALMHHVAGKTIHFTRSGGDRVAVINHHDNQPVEVATSFARITRALKESEELDENLPGSYSSDVTMTSPRKSSSAGRGAGWRPKETEPAPVINRKKYRPGSMKRAMTKDEAVNEEAGLTEETIDYNNYTITSSPHSSPKHELGVAHVSAAPGKMKALGIHTEKGGKYGRTSHVTVTNNTTGERSQHNVYQREWGDGGLTASIRSLHKPHPEHHKVLHHFLAGRKTVNPLRTPRFAEEVELDEDTKAYDAHYDKQTDAVKNRLNLHMRRGRSYPEAVEKTKGCTPLREEANLTEETIDYNNYTITSCPSKKGGKYGRTSHVTVTNKTTGERSQHHVYQSEWDYEDHTASIRPLHKPHAEHHKVLHHFLTGRKKVNPLRTLRFAEVAEETEDDGWHAHKEMHGKVSKEDWKKGWRYNRLRRRVPFFHEPTRTYHAKIKDIKEENLDELRAATIDSYRKKAYDQQPAGDDGSQLYKKRKTGRDLAFKKVTHGAKIMATEEEALDELSKDTVKRYKDTATKNLDYHATAWDNIAQADANAKGFTKAQGASFKKHDSEAEKRYKGIKMAIKKLAKEDIIDRAYERYVPEEVKYTPYELFANRLEGLSESHAVTLMDLFESLSRENQAKMTQDAKTDEGLNKLLNFAIENRGE